MSWKVTDPDCRRSLMFECPVCNECRYYEIHPLDAEGGIRIKCDVCRYVVPMRCTSCDDWEDVIEHWPRIESIIPIDLQPPYAMLDGDQQEAIDELPEDMLSGVATFLRTDGEEARGMEKEDFIYVLNQAAGVERIDDPNSKRSKHTVVPSDAIDDDEAVPRHEYGRQPLGDELLSWARAVTRSDADLDGTHEDIEPEDDGDDDE